MTAALAGDGADVLERKIRSIATRLSRGKSFIQLSNLLKVADRALNHPIEVIFSVVLKMVREGQLSRVKTTLCEYVRQLLDGFSEGERLEYLETILLSNENRRAVYQFVVDHPGATFSRVRDATGLGVSTLKLYLNQLVNCKFLEAAKVGGSWIFHSPEVEARKAILEFFRNRRSFRPLLAFLEGGPRDLNAIASRLGMKKTSVRYLLGRLLAHGIVSGGGAEGYRLNDFNPELD